MAAHDSWHPPLKAPSVEIHDLLSDCESSETSPPTSEHIGKHDAYSTVLSVHDSDVQWHAPLKAPAIELDDSLARNVSSTGMKMGDVLVNREDDAKARDASIEGSDSDGDSQWSLYEDALGEDEEEMALHTSM